MSTTIPGRCTQEHMFSCLTIRNRTCARIPLTSSNSLKCSSSRIVTYQLNALLNDAIAEEIDKKQVVCFFKDYEKSYDSRLERTFLVMKLYTEEDTVSGKTQPSSNLVADTAEVALQNCAPTTNVKKKQMFSPSTKEEVDEIETKVGVDQESLLAMGVVKREITFTEHAVETEEIVIVENVPSPGREAGKAASGSECPVKKLKNEVSHE